ncbi:MAG: hypothetical protein JO256_15525 [Alphaproteobacteria bacterium]|nr:hypothetical protein [Alphaproteobacteria bacterium]
MGQSMGSIGGGKQSGAGGDRQNQPERNPGQRLSDQQPPKPEKGDKEGGVEQGSRAVR